MASENEAVTQAGMITKKRGRPRGPKYAKKKPPHNKIGFASLGKQMALNGRTQVLKIGIYTRLKPKQIWKSIERKKPRTFRRL